jgi:hypothetical protein
MLIVAVLDGKFTAQLAHTFINFNWMLQAQISMVFFYSFSYFIFPLLNQGFLLYWQASGHLPALFNMMAQFKGYSPLWMHKFASISYAILFFLDIAVVVLILVLYWAMGPKEQANPSEHNRVIQVINVSFRGLIWEDE